MENITKNKLITKTRRLKDPLGNWTKKWNEIRKNYRIYSDGKSVFERQNDIFKKINLTSNSKTQVNGPTKEAVPAIITASKTVINKKQRKTKNTTKTTFKYQKRSSLYQMHQCINQKQHGHG
jgi:BRCT domain type II-containing protein